jgi:hypothetical protein
MEWATFFKEWGPMILAAIPNIVLAAQWALRKEFATTDSLIGVHKVLDDQAREQQAEIVRAHHRIDLLAKDLEGVPTYEVTNELGRQLSKLDVSVGELKTELRGIDDRTERTDSAVTRIEQHLLSQAA